MVSIFSAKLKISSSVDICEHLFEENIIKIANYPKKICKILETKEHPEFREINYWKVKNEKNIY